MDMLSQYGLFLAQIITYVLAIIIVVAVVVGILSKNKGPQDDNLEVKSINDKFKKLRDALQKQVLGKKELKALQKMYKKQEKDQSKSQARKVYVLNFHGDIKASAVKSLRQEISAVLLVAKPEDEVVITVESGGGVVHGYGLAASQLQRIRAANIPLTVCVDKVAASGGYLMSCVANKILAAPFAIIGSIGVIAQIPNFHRLLKERNIDFEQITAGEYKRTLTMFGENTKQGREKFQQDLEEIHDKFKEFILQFRPQVDIAKVATGEHWLANKAIELNLIDDIMTSDDYLMQASNGHTQVVEISYQTKKSLPEKFLAKAQSWIKDSFSFIS